MLPLSTAVSDQIRLMVRSLEESNADSVVRELRQAIALSIEQKAETSDVASTKLAQNPQLAYRHGHHSAQEDTTRKWKRKPSTNQVQMNMDEVVINYCRFDETGQGWIELKDLQKMAVAHDFTWTDKELKDMIRCFDTDGDGKLTLDDFRNIVAKCNMLKATEAL